jgi:hypothetical protein
VQIVLREEIDDEAGPKIAREPGLGRVREWMGGGTQRDFVGARPGELTKPLRAFGGFDAAFTRQGFEDSRDEVGTVAVFRIRHFIDLADETFGQADGDLRHARGARAYFTFLSHNLLLLQVYYLEHIHYRQFMETIKPEYSQCIKSASNFLTLVRILFRVPMGERPGVVTSSLPNKGDYAYA